MMFSEKIKKQLRSHFAIPLRQYQLKEHADQIIGVTRYKYVSNLIYNLQKEKIIKPYTLTAKNKKNITLYCSRTIKKLTPYELAESLFPKGYFCNLSSIYYHQLTNQVPNSVYICNDTITAKQKNHKNILTNSTLRSAFIGSHRYTNFVFNFGHYEVIVVDRAKKSRYGVVEIHSSRGLLPNHSSVTCCERALIDAVVSPQYNGGILSVFEFFRSAQKKINIAKLLEIYEQLDFIYPYSQSIGFFLDKAGLKKYATAIYKAFPPVRTFYIDHNAKTSWSYDKKWMIYYPPGLIDED